MKGQHLKQRIKGIVNTDRQITHSLLVAESLYRKSKGEITRLQAIPIQKLKLGERKNLDRLVSIVRALDNE